MPHSNRTVLCVLGVAALAAVLIAVGVPPAWLAVVIVCPLMMFVMMRTMSGMGEEDHRGHGGDHDPETHPVRNP